MSGTDTQERTVYRLSTTELERTQAKIEKLNKRAAKKGLAGSQVGLEHLGEVKVTYTEDHQGNLLAFPLTVVYQRVAITGTAPKFEGWNFIAALDFDRNAGLVTRTVPGYEGRVQRESLQEGRCDHCKTDRYRKTTYVLEHEDGRQVQIGSTCIKDFLGQDVRPAFIFPKDIEELDDEPGFGRGGWRDADVSVETALAVAWAAVTEYGFVRSSAQEFGGGDVPTKHRISQVIFPADREPFRSEDLGVQARLQPLAEKAQAQAKLIRDYILSDQFSGDSEYVVNLKSIVSAERVSSRFFGLLASAPQAWARSVERDLKRAAEKAEIKNEFFGQEKERLELTVRVRSIKSIPGSYGYDPQPTALYTLVTEDGHLVKWFSSNWGLGEEVNEHTFRIKATVKGHEVYNDTKSTVITRAKVLEDIAPAS